MHVTLIPEATEAVILAALGRTSFPAGSLAAVRWRVEEGSPRGFLSVSVLRPVAGSLQETRAATVEDAADAFWLLYAGAPPGDLSITPCWAGWVEVRNPGGERLSRDFMRSLDHPPSWRVREVWSARGFSLRGESTVH